MSRIVACLKCGGEFTALGSRGPARRFCPACKSEYRHDMAAARRKPPASNPDAKVRRYARAEARERGVPVEQVLREWRA